MRKKLNMEDQVFIDFDTLVSTTKVGTSEFQETIGAQIAFCLSIIPAEN